METSCDGGRGNEKHLSNRNLITLNFPHKQIRSRPHLSVLTGLQLSLISKYSNYFYSQGMVYCQALGILYYQTIFFLYVNIERHALELRDFLFFDTN